MKVKRCENGFLPKPGALAMTVAVALFFCGASAWGVGTVDSGEFHHAQALTRWVEDGVVEEYRQGFTRLVLEDVVGSGGYRTSQLPDPPRLVVDIQEPPRFLSKDRFALRGDAFAELRVGRYPDKMRVVLDFRQAQDARARVRSENGHLIVEFPGRTAGVPDVQGMGGPEVPVVAANPGRVSAIDFQFEPDSSDVVIKLERGEVPYEILDQGDVLVVRMPGVVIPEHLQRPIDTRGFASAIVGIDPSQRDARGKTEATVTLRLRGKVAYTDASEGREIRIRVKNPETAPAPATLPPPALHAAETTRVRTAQPAGPETVSTPPAGPESRPRPAAAERRAPPPVETPSRVPERAYHGRKISLDFKDADIQNVLRLIAEVSGKNIVISEAVKGKVTVRLLNVPWDMALDVILRTYALDKEILGPNILRVAPHTQLKKERDEAIQAARSLVEVEDLNTEVVTLNYAKAQDLQALLSRMTSRRADASILVDNRTNSLVIKDIPSAIDEMVVLVRNLDRQTAQVLIEAKIVELDVEHAQALGIQWGTAYHAGPATGNPTGMNFPGTATVGGVAQNVSGISPVGVANPVVNLPAAIDSSAGGALGFSLASITNSFRLDMQLSALEKQKHARILSSPRVATLNNQEAWIQQGEEVPYQTTSDMGTQTMFKDATLRLSVTPSINADRSIIMNIKVNKDTALREVSAGIIIGKKEASTSVLVHDGETAVIGGIYTDDKQRDAGGVPWFMNIPGLGYLFKNQGKAERRTELMIFITPRIIPTRTAPVEQWIQ